MASTSHYDELIITYPARNMDTEQISFLEACRRAIQQKVPLHLTTDEIVVTETIRLRGQDSLTIQGCVRQDDDNENNGRTNHQQCVIRGDLHSLFLLNNKSCLNLINVDLDHTLEPDDHKQVGAAINLRYKGHATVRLSKIVSRSGFCVWAVQKSRVHLEHCELVATGRSAMVCFGQAQCRLEHTLIDQAGVHGLCARGACHLHLVDCIIQNSAARAIYAYANASVELDRCRISNTIHPQKAAIEVSSMMGSIENGRQDERTPKASSLLIRDTCVVNNQGVGIRLRGPVICEAEGMNEVTGNKAKDWDVLLDEEEFAIDPADGTSLQSLDTEAVLPPLRRDEAGSSFRKGDWLCSRCQRINPGRQLLQEERCGNCQWERSLGSRLLSMEEVRCCNQGMDIRKEAPNCHQNSIDSASYSDEVIILWEFDGDDEKGWVQYDQESSALLEKAYQEEPSSSCVHLAQGKYQVDLNRMEQTNTNSQFLRFVRRRVIASPHN